MNLSFWRKNKTSLEDYMETLVFETPESEHLFEIVMGLLKIQNCDSSVLLRGLQCQGNRGDPEDFGE